MKTRNHEIIKLTPEAEKARREYFRKYREKNADRLREYGKTWRKENPEKVSAYNARYWEQRAANRSREILPTASTNGKE